MSNKTTVPRKSPYVEFKIYEAPDGVSRPEIRLFGSERTPTFHFRLGFRHPKGDNTVSGCRLPVTYDPKEIAKESGTGALDGIIKALQALNPQITADVRAARNKYMAEERRKGKLRAMEKARQAAEVRQKKSTPPNGHPPSTQD